VTSLPEALAAALAERASVQGIALVSARSEFLVCRVEGGELVPPPGVLVPTDVYEVRAAFSGPGAEGELRFHGPDRTAFVVAPGGDRVLRLLLGTATGDAPAGGWVRLREARMRDVVVPYEGPVTVGDRFAWVVERVVREDDDGNVHVVDEVLRGLDRVDASARRRRSTAREEVR
jgi:hypothetical protein